MGILGGITSSFLNPVNFALLATGPAGWAALATRTLGAAIGREVIGQLGQQLGLPQGVINMAQNAFSAATGTAGGPLSLGGVVSQLAQDFNLSPTQQGELQRGAELDVQQLTERLAEAFNTGRERAETSRSSGGGRGKSWLQAIADAMAKVIDQKVKDLDRMSRALDQQGSNKSVKASTDLQVAAQEFSYLMNVSSTVIKTIGEGLSGMARKQ